jgi:hypothetical protein
VVHVDERWQGGDRPRPLRPRHDGQGYAWLWSMPPAGGAGHPEQQRAPCAPSFQPHRPSADLPTKTLLTRCSLDYNAREDGAAGAEWLRTLMRSPVAKRHTSPRRGWRAFVARRGSRRGRHSVAGAAGIATDPVPTAHGGTGSGRQGDFGAGVGPPTSAGCARAVCRRTGAGCARRPGRRASRRGAGGRPGHAGSRWHGWYAYVGFVEAPSSCKKLDAWSRRRQREQRRRGVSRDLAWNTVQSAHGPWRSPSLTASAMAWVCHASSAAPIAD